jgi:hypothetical protein
LTTDAGLTFAEIREMTMTDVDRLFRHWKIYPPVRDLVAAAIGFKPKDAAADKPKYLNAADMRRIMRQTGGKVPGVGPNMGR